MTANCTIYEIMAHSKTGVTLVKELDSSLLTRFYYSSEQSMVYHLQVNLN